VKVRQLIAAAIWGLLLGAGLTLLLNGPIRFGTTQVPESVYLTATAAHLASKEPISIVTSSPSDAAQQTLTLVAPATTSMTTTSAAATASAAPTLNPGPTNTSEPTSAQTATLSPTVTASRTTTPAASSTFTPEPAVTPQPTLPPTASPTLTPTPELPSSQSYTVQPGDNLYEIALQFGVTVRTLTEANGIQSTTLLHPGMVLVIPIPGATAQASAETPQLSSTLESTPGPSASPPIASGSTPTSTLPVGTSVPTTTAQGTVLPVPTLLAPADGQVFSDRDEIELRWQSIGPLPADTYYVITVAYTHLGEIWYDETPWTQESSWRLSDHVYLLSLSDDGSFRWSVQVMRQTGVGEEGRPTGVALSESSEVRSLIWRGESSGSTQGTPPPPPP
jgi:LysM repeat protein